MKREPTIQKTNLFQSFSAISHGKVQIIEEFNESPVKISKIRDAFTWHRHEEADELFMVVKGEVRMEFREKFVDLGPGEFLVIPKGLEHRPVAGKDAHILLLEPAAFFDDPPPP